MTIGVTGKCVQMRRRKHWELSPQNQKKSGLCRLYKRRSLRHIEPISNLAGVPHHSDQR